VLAHQHLAEAEPVHDPVEDKRAATNHVDTPRVHHADSRADGPGLGQQGKSHGMHVGRTDTRVVDPGRIVSGQAHRDRRYRGDRTRQSDQRLRLSHRYGISHRIQGRVDVGGGRRDLSRRRRVAAQVPLRHPDAADIDGDRSVIRGDDPPQTPPDYGGAARPPGPPGPPRPGLLPEDEPLLAELGRDGRTSHAALATAIHWHESTVRRRMEELCRSGLLHFEVDLDARCLGMNVSALLWLKVEPSRLDAVGHALAGHPEVPFAAATTGPSNVVVTALFRDTQHLYEYLTGPLASLPGVSSVETAPIIRTLKRTGSVH